MLLFCNIESAAKKRIWGREDMELGEMHLTDCKILKTIILRILMDNIYCADEGKE